MDAETITDRGAADAEAPPRDVKRHALSARLWHWTNALSVFVLLMSGLMIFNAHPRLYWGQYGANTDRSWLEVGSTPTSGYLRIGSVRIGTTGILGHRVENGQVNRRAFPGWMTIPSSYSLAAGRRWHFAFAWLMSIGLILFLLHGLIRGRTRRFIPRLTELRPAHIWHDIRQHARLRFPTGLAAIEYNSLQKLSYFSVIFILLPLMILSGLAMSPTMNAAWPWLIDLFGGRASARSIHFIIAWTIAAFILVHLVMVVLAGPVNEIRSMITGWYRLPKARDEGEQA